jgi:hypothetical protein
MRPPRYVTVVVIGIFSVAGWTNHRRIHELRIEREAKASQATASQLSAEPAESDSGSADGGHATWSNRRSEDRSGLDAVLAYARALPFSEELPAAERLRRVTVETERIQQLNRTQLSALIAELGKADGMDAGVRQTLLAFTLKELAKASPREAFQLLERLKDQLPPRGLLPEMLRVWGGTEPVTGRAWLDALPDWVPADQVPELERAFLEGAVAASPAFALEWIAARTEPGDFPDWFMWAPEHLPEAATESWQAAMLAHPVTSKPIKEWLATLNLSERKRVLLAEAGDLAGEIGDSVYPEATPVPGKPGLVFNPYTNQIIDVRGIPPGSLVKDPTVAEGKVFRVPGSPETSVEETAEDPE